MFAVVCIVLLITVIAFAIIFVRKIKELYKQQKQIEDYRKLLTTTYSQIQTLINENRYFSKSEIRKIKEKYAETIRKLEQNKNVLPVNDINSREMLKKLSCMENTFITANRNFVIREKQEKASFFKSYDDSQSNAIITDEDQMLILAGAGSGKTRTIEGKVTYLANFRKINPSEILLVSFTNATVNDLQARDLQGVRAMTFHQIGMDILRKTMNIPPSVLDPYKKRRSNQRYFTKSGI